jgi:hypothetical protein
METVGWHIISYAHVTRSTQLHYPQTLTISSLHQASPQTRQRKRQNWSSRRGTRRVPGSSPSRQPSCELWMDR